MTVAVPGTRTLVLYTVDTLRADALELYDPSVSRTPNLARLAADATRFDNTQSQCPWTLPSICSLMTSILSGVGSSAGFWTRRSCPSLVLTR